MSAEVAQMDAVGRLGVAIKRIALLVKALETARPYVHTYAENCPQDDGGAEAEADLKIIDAALAEVNQ